LSRGDSRDKRRVGNSRHRRGASGAIPQRHRVSEDSTEFFALILANLEQQKSARIKPIGLTLPRTMHVLNSCGAIGENPHAFAEIRV
jgi:hypothetical protein